MSLGAFYGWYVLAFAAYLAALGLVRSTERHPLSPRGRRVSVALIGLVAILARLVLLGTTPTLSDDIYRYHWDGRVQQAGIDPYALPPNDPALRFLRDDHFAHLNFPHLRTIYPPLTELAFWLGASLERTWSPAWLWWAGRHPERPRHGGGVEGLTSQKAVFLSAELTMVLSLLVILVRRRQSPLWVVAYAWHPLTILEIAGSGHNDALGIALGWAGIAAWHVRSWGGCTLAWIGAFLSKFGSIIMAPWWWWRRAARGWLVVFLLASALPFAAYPTAVTALFESLSAMTGRVESNASLYLLLVGLFRHAVLVRLIATGVWLVFLLWWARRQDDPIRYIVGVAGVGVLVSPVLHPWYLLWLVPCFCFVRVPAFLALSGTVVLAYTVWPAYLAGGPWTMPLWARLAEYVPVFGLGMWGLGRCVWRSLSLPGTKPQPSATS